MSRIGSPDPQDKGFRSVSETEKKIGSRNAFGIESQIGRLGHMISRAELTRSCIKMMQV
jgi:hypothetical protein